MTAPDFDPRDPGTTQPAVATAGAGIAGATVGSGRYRLDAHIATGGMGAVWRAYDTVLEREVAVKLLRPELADDRGFKARFESEARNAARVQHPGIAAVYDYGQDEPEHGSSSQRAYLVMELVDGRPLDELFRAGRLGRTALVGLVAQTADVLQAAHDRDLVHRDIKPANILVTPSGQVKVTDFGIAKALSEASVTDTGIVLGTPHYLSPEQAEGRPAQPASDVYSLGVVLYEGLSGQRPFVRDTPVATALAHLRDEPPPLPSDVPPWLATVTMAALAKNPADRPTSAAAMASALRAEDASAVGGTTGTALRAGGAASGLAAAAAAASTGPTRAVSADEALASAPSTPATGSAAAAEEPASGRRRFWPVLAVAVLLALTALIAALVLTQGGGDEASTPSVTPSEDSGGDGGGNRGDGGNGGGGQGESTEPSEEPTTEEPTTEEPTETTEPTEPTEEPTTEEPTTEEPTETTEPTEEPTTEEPTETTEPTEEPTTEEPATEEPTETTEPAEEPTTEEPATEEPAETPAPGNSGENGEGEGNSEENGNSGENGLGTGSENSGSEPPGVGVEAQEQAEAGTPNPGNSAAQGAPAPGGP